MKYYILKQIASYLNENEEKIHFIKRVNNNTIKIDFSSGLCLYCDMTKGQSKLYTNTMKNEEKREFLAPFDIILNKRFSNAKIKKIYLYNDDKLLNIDISHSNSYKKELSTLQLEFTSKHTNIIILDENRVILEALRHIDTMQSSRVVKVGQTLEELGKITFEVQNASKDLDVLEFLENEYKKDQEKNLSILKRQKTKQVVKKIKKLEDLLYSFEDEKSLEEKSLKLYSKANLLLSSLHLIKPYDKEITLQDFEGVEQTLSLDISYRPQEYVKYLFTRAKKSKQKASKLYLEKDNLEQKIIYFKRLEANILKAKFTEELEFLFPKKEKNQRKTQKLEHYQSFYFKGYKIMLGRNERENIYLLEHARANDFWFHLKDLPSAHVIVPNSKKTLPEDVIQKAGFICANFSLDGDFKIEVAYTKRANVKIQNKANVLYNPYDILLVNKKSI